MIYTQICIIVPKEVVGLARALCEACAEGEAGKGMLTTPLSHDGNLPETHYISEGMVESKFGDILPLKLLDEENTILQGQPQFVVDNSNGLVTIEQVNELFSVIDVSKESAFEAMSRLNLKMVVETL